MSAALQTEKEFLEFMFSLPQTKKLENVKDKQHNSVDSTNGDAPLKTNSLVSSPVLEQKSIIPMELEPLSPETPRKKSPSRHSGQIPGVTSKVGLDHLDHLCRIMEQLGDLKEQNTRLQRRVHYLEDLKTLQEMHKDLQDSMEARRQAMNLGTISLSETDLRLEELSNICMYRGDSEDSLDPSFIPDNSTKGKTFLKNSSTMPNFKNRLRSHSVETSHLVPKFSSPWTNIFRKQNSSRIIPESGGRSCHPLHHRQRTIDNSQENNSMEESSPESSCVHTEESILNIYKNFERRSFVAKFCYFCFIIASYIRDRRRIVL